MQVLQRTETLPRTRRARCQGRVVPGALGKTLAHAQGKGVTEKGGIALKEEGQQQGGRASRLGESHAKAAGRRTRESGLAADTSRLASLPLCRRFPLNSTNSS